MQLQKLNYRLAGFKKRTCVMHNKAGLDPLEVVMEKMEIFS